MDSDSPLSEPAALPTRYDNRKNDGDSTLSEDQDSSESDFGAGQAVDVDNTEDEVDAESDNVGGGFRRSDNNPSVGGKGLGLGMGLDPGLYGPRRSDRPHDELAEDFEPREYQPETSDDASDEYYDDGGAGSSRRNGKKKVKSRSNAVVGSFPNPSGGGSGSSDSDYGDVSHHKVTTKFKVKRKKAYVESGGESDSGAPRISMRNGKPMPNYKENAMDFEASMSEGDRGGASYPVAVLEGRNRKNFFDRCVLTSRFLDAEQDVIEAVFGHMRDEALSESLITVPSYDS